MPKQLITVLGLVVSLGVIALGVFLVAVPLYFQAVGVDTQTTSVANTNALYQAQLDRLKAEQDNLEQINANVADLRSQIPVTGQLDDVFEVVARAAEASGVALSAVTAGEQVVFTPRSGTEEPAASTSQPEPAPTDATNAADPSTTPEAPADAGVPEGRQQVDFVISAIAGDMGQVTAFLDALRAGPRLLSTITTTANQSNEGAIEIQITALTYVDAEG